MLGGKKYSSAVQTKANQWLPTQNDASDKLEDPYLPRRKALCPVGVGVASVGVGVAALATDPGGGAWELG